MVNLKVSLGTINYTDYIHITACKVSSPSVVAWETWLDVPVTNYDFIIPDLDPENYIVSYYDAPTDSSLGTMVMQLIVNASTGDTVGERRFYTCGGPNTGDPADGDSSITDPYLVGKTVTGVFKEAFRYYEPVTEFSSDNVAGSVSVLTGVPFSVGEKIAVEISYVGSTQQTTTGGGGGLYSSTITVVEDTKTLSIDDLDARVRLAGTSSKQVVTLPALSSFAAGKGYYFDNSVGGTAVQPKLLTSGTDKIRFSGFMTGSNLFSEFWVSQGEHLKLVKYDDNYWEVIGDYAGVKVGERVSLGYNAHPNILIEFGEWFDGDEYGRMWWWLNNVLPSTHKYTGTETSPVDASRVGQFMIHSTLKKFRMPFTPYMTERGLNNFRVYGTDTQRAVNFPGGFQDEMVGQLIVSLQKGDGYTGHLQTPFVFGPGQTGNLQEKDDIVVNKNNEQRLRNIGVVFARRI